jgi:hypothetical protein
MMMLVLSEVHMWYTQHSEELAVSTSVFRRFVIIMLIKKILLILFLAYFPRFKKIK